MGLFVEPARAVYRACMGFWPKKKFPDHILTSNLHTCLKNVSPFSLNQVPSFSNIQAAHGPWLSRMVFFGMHDQFMLP